MATTAKVERAIGTIATSGLEPNSKCHADQRRDQSHDAPASHVLLSVLRSSVSAKTEQSTANRALDLHRELSGHSANAEDGIEILAFCGARLEPQGDGPDKEAMPREPCPARTSRPTRGSRQRPPRTRLHAMDAASGVARRARAEIQHVHGHAVEHGDRRPDAKEAPLAEDTRNVVGSDRPVPDISIVTQNAADLKAPRRSPRPARVFRQASAAAHRPE